MKITVQKSPNAPRNGRVKLTKSGKVALKKGSMQGRDLRAFNKLPEAVETHRRTVVRGVSASAAAGIEFRKKGDVLEDDRGPTLMSYIRSKLKERVLVRNRQTGKLEKNERILKSAEAFIKMMEKGSYVHAKEYLDRTEGKPIQRISDADGGKIKLYAEMPLDGPGAP